MTTPTTLPAVQHRLLLALYWKGETSHQHREQYQHLTRDGYLGLGPDNRYNWYVTQKGMAYCHAQQAAEHEGVSA